MIDQGDTPRPSPRRRALPWLLLILSWTIAVALWPYELERRHHARVELCRTRDEAAELRHSLFRAQADLDDTRHELKKKQLLSEALEEKLAKMAEGAVTKSEKSDGEKSEKPK